MKVKFKFNAAVFMLIPLFCLLFASTSMAQAYKVGVGWRFGTSVSGVNFKISPKKGLAFEGILGLFPNGTTGTFMVERYQPVLWRFLQVYGGAGGHARFNYRNENPTGKLAFQLPLNANNPLPIGVGIDVIAGLEMKVPLIPIAINAEIKPSMEFTPAGNLDFALDPAIGVKMIFGKWKRKKKRKGLFRKKNERDNEDSGLFRKKENREKERGGLFRKKDPKQQEDRGGFFRKKEKEPEKKGLFERRS